MNSRRLLTHFRVLPVQYPLSTARSCIASQKRSFVRQPSLPPTILQAYLRPSQSPTTSTWCWQFERIARIGGPIPTWSRFEVLSSHRANGSNAFKKVEQIRAANVVNRHSSYDLVVVLLDIDPVELLLDSRVVVEFEWT